MSNASVSFCSMISSFRICHSLREDLSISVSIQIYHAVRDEFHLAKIYAAQCRTDEINKNCSTHHYLSFSSLLCERICHHPDFHWMNIQLCALAVKAFKRIQPQRSPACLPTPRGLRRACRSERAGRQSDAKPSYVFAFLSDLGG